MWEEMGEGRFSDFWHAGGDMGFEGLGLPKT